MKSINKSFSEIIKNSNFDMLEEMLKFGYPFGCTDCALAARMGKLDVLKWLREKKCSWDETTCSEAAGIGHLCILRYAVRHGCPYDEFTGYNAGFNGQFSVLEWLYEKRFFQDNNFMMYTCEGAAKNGQVEVLRLLYEWGCAFNNFIAGVAAYNGRLEALQFIVEKGRPLNENVYARALAGKNDKVITWLCSVNCRESNKNRV